MRTLLASTTVLFTILLSLAFGIACGYVVINTILRAFDRNRPKPEPARATAAIATTASGR